MSFYIPHAGILHGFAGYFEAVLYGNVGLSIHPERKDAVSKDMLSWFPLFFPIKVCFQLDRWNGLSRRCQTRLGATLSSK
jgi:protein arginine N-methyltransferase 5